MAGRARKAPNAIAGHRKRPADLRALPAPVEDAEELPAPTAPRGLLARSRDIWKRFWSSELSEHVDREADMYRVERWIRDVDELERAWRLFRSERFVTGSMGQVRINTVWKVVQDCEARVRLAEDQLGMTPLARARLGLTLGQAGNALDELNRRMNEPDEPKRPRPATQNGQVIEGDWSPL